MNSNTALSLFFKQCCDKFRTRVWLFETFFALSIFFFFLGFICGNLFGTFLIYFRPYVFWDGLIILLTILIIEWINYLTFYLFQPSRVSLDDEYRYQNAPQLIDFEQTEPVPPQIQTYQEIKIIRNLNKVVRFGNFYKMGLLLGFFIDAFKVGS